MPKVFTYNDVEFCIRPDAMVPDANDQPVELSTYLGMAAADVAAAKLEMLRDERDRRLAESDWAGGSDLPQSIKDAWYPYRQALRDITDTYDDIDTVVWPTKP